MTVRECEIATCKIKEAKQSADQNGIQIISYLPPVVGFPAYFLRISFPKGKFASFNRQFVTTSRKLD